MNGEVRMILLTSASLSAKVARCELIESGGDGETHRAACLGRHRMRTRLLGRDVGKDLPDPRLPSTARLHREDGEASAQMRGTRGPEGGASALDAPAVGLYITIGLYNKAVMKLSERLDLTFAALADPTRRAILARLATGEATVTELAEPFEMSQPAVSRHLKVLERAGLISMDVDAQRRPRKLEPKAFEEAVEWVDRYRERFEQHFQRLDTLLETLQQQPTKSTRNRK